MILYCILLLVVAFVAYFFGSLDSRVLASVLVFRKNLAKLGKGNVWVSNFRRVYGIKGFIQLLLVELVKDLLPILLGSLLLGIKGHGDVGRAFAGFCLTFGCAFPVMYRFKGNPAVFPLVLTAVCSKSSVGIAAGMVVLVLVVATRHVSLAVAAAAVVMVVVGILEFENNVVTVLCALTAAIVLIKHIPGIRKILHGQAEKFKLINDISYKFDEDF